LFTLKDYFFEIQILINIFIFTAIIILVFLYLKTSASKKKNPLVEKIEYLCKNLKILIDQSERSSDIIQKKIEEFKALYDKIIVEMEKKTSDLDDIVNKLERNENISDKLKEKDKYSKIKNLLNEGHSIDEIAKMLKINKGEVELIHNIIKK
jgi:hypothetical protein